MNSNAISEDKTDIKNTEQKDGSLVSIKYICSGVFIIQH
jgi:hypothetical protein